MKSPAMRSYILSLPLYPKAQKSASTSEGQKSYKMTSSIFWDTENALPIVSLAKLSCREVGGRSSNIFSSLEDDAKRSMPTAKPNCREVGGKSSNIFGPEPVVSSNKAGQPSPGPSIPWDGNGHSVREAPMLVVNPNRTFSHFSGSGLHDKDLPKFVPGKRLDPTTNQSHISVSVGEDSTRIPLDENPASISRLDKNRSQISFY